MTDDVLTRTYADHHQRMSRDIGDAIAAVINAVRVTLDRLHAHQFDAPWQCDRAPR